MSLREALDVQLGALGVGDDRAALVAGLRLIADGIDGAGVADLDLVREFRMWLQVLANGDEGDLEDEFKALERLMAKAE